MKKITWSDDLPWADILRSGEDEEVVVLRDGHAVALIIPFNDEDMAWYAKERDPSFIESIARARSDVQAGRTVSHEELKKQLGFE
jgi:antitoxin (DNA-binding transcriptional repressor) of toxin-antitoxin stability system